MRAWNITHGVFLVLLGVLGACRGYSQGQIPGGDFENWTTPPFANYEQPADPWWATLNPLTSLGGPETVEKTTDAHGGSYAAKLTTLQWGTLTIPGLLLSGEFDIQNPSFLIQGQPFSDLPHAFRGWYKYTSVGGDSAGIAALLTRWNANLMRRDTIGMAVYSVIATQSAWTAFDLPFVYQQPGVYPDTILVALVSSGDGQNFNGQVGSTLWIDDLSLDYTTAGRAPVSEAVPAIHWSEQQLIVELPAALGASDLRLYDLHGRVLLTQELRAGRQAIGRMIPAGIYGIEIGRGSRILLRSTIACFHP